jgi:hypothetical protein
MVGDLIFYIITKFFEAIAFVLPSWTVWPQILVDGMQYIFESFAKFNFILPIDTFLQALLWFVHFEALYFGAKLSLKAINFMRGTGTGLEIK